MRDVSQWQPEQRESASRPGRPARGETIALALGRALFGGYFLYNGINHFLKRASLTQYARAKEVPAAPVAVPGSGLLLILGGLSLLTGRRPKLGAALITTFLVGVTPQMHAFWRTEGGERGQEFVNFMKNLALVGGAALAAANPEPWPLSASARHRAA